MSSNPIPVPNRCFQVWAGENGVGWYQLSWGLTTPTIIGYIHVVDTTSPGVETWAVNNSFVNMLQSVQQGDCGQLEIRRVGGPISLDDVGTWQLQNETTPSKSTAPTDSSVVFVHAGTPFTVAIGINFSNSPTGIKLQSTQWWASDTTTNDTLDPVQGGNPVLLRGYITSVPIPQQHWVWPKQQVNRVLPTA